MRIAIPKGRLQTDVLATFAAAAVESDFVGVDLLPLANGDYVVLEVNGAVELTAEYSLGRRDVFEEVARVIARDPTPLDVGATGSCG